MHFRTHFLENSTTELLSAVQAQWEMREWRENKRETQNRVPSYIGRNHTWMCDFLFRWLIFYKKYLFSLCPLVCQQRSSQRPLRHLPETCCGGFLSKKKINSCISSPVSFSDQNHSCTQGLEMLLIWSIFVANIIKSRAVNWSTIQFWPLGQRSQYINYDKNCSVFAYP